jgi:ElaB/YqjD/DUF883 family membrane-anchored ribosome-binding protein
MSKDHGRRARDAASEIADDAREALDQAHEAIEDGIDEAHAYLKRQWSERPVAVTATALGLGLVIGLLLGSRR